MVKLPFALIISGPTASGKSDLALHLAEKVSAEIINADVGQFYTPFSVGTAKPNWKNSPVPHHLFDIINEPKNLTSAQYRKLVIDKINEVASRDKLPIIVGGSLFYLKSLFYPPLELPENNNEFQFDEDDLWGQLNKIDPKRASQIHKNDTYRIKRALLIWKQTSTKPSLYEPQFKAEFESLFVFLSPEKETLQERINVRTVEMIKQQGWIDEVKQILGTEWEIFLKVKKLIGYPEIITWLSANQNVAELIEAIQGSTWQYSRRQVIFWKKLQKQLERDGGDNISTLTLEGTLKDSLLNIETKLISKYTRKSSSTTLD